MIDYLTFIEDLSTVEKLLQNEDASSVFNIIMAKGKIRDLKRKYEKRVSDFESDMAPKEEVDVLKMSSGSSFMENYQNSNMRDYGDTQEYEENSEGDIVPVEQKNDLSTDLETTTELLNQNA